MRWTLQVAALGISSRMHPRLLFNVLQSSNETAPECFPNRLLLGSAMSGWIGLNLLFPLLPTSTGHMLQTLQKHLFKSSEV